MIYFNEHKLKITIMKISKEKTKKDSKI